MAQVLFESFRIEEKKIIIKDIIMNIELIKLIISFNKINGYKSGFINNIEILSHLKNLLKKIKRKKPFKP